MKARLRDGLNWMSKLTPRRIWNLGLLMGSYHFSRAVGRPFHRGLPTSISVEPTTACNLGCPECPSGLRQFTRPTGNARLETFRRILDELGSRLTYINFYFQGEPFINPQLFEMISLASRYGIYTSTSTNAHFLDEDAARKTVRSGLDRMIISIDGTTQEVYEQYRRGGKLSKVLQGAENIIRAKRELKSGTPHVIFQFLVVRPNEHQVGEVYDLADKMGVDEVKLKTAQVYEPRDDHPLIPKQEKYSRYRRNADGDWELKNKLNNQCWRMWNGCVFTWNGSVVPCCFDKDASHNMGMLNGQSFRDIWRGTEYRNFRSQLLRSREEIDICRNCSEGTKVWG